jgi:hypothetical protein
VTLRTRIGLALWDSLRLLALPVRFLALIFIHHDVSLRAIWGDLWNETKTALQERP